MRATPKRSARTYPDSGGRSLNLSKDARRLPASCRKTSRSMALV